jgi:hypothetical protein
MKHYFFYFLHIYTNRHIDINMGRGKRKHTFLINENMQTDENTKTQKRQKNT